MTRLLYPCTLLFALFPLAGAAQMTTGTTYSITETASSACLSNVEASDTLGAVSEFDTTHWWRNTFLFEVADKDAGTYYLKDANSGYVQKTVVGETVPLGSLSENTAGEAVEAPASFTLVATGSNLLIRDLSTSLNMNCYFGTNGGVTLWSGTGDASQWKIFEVESGDEVTSVAEGTEYYLQTQMNASIGQYAYYSGDNIYVSASPTAASVFTFIAAETEGYYYIHNVDSNTEILQGSSAVNLKMAASSIQGDILYYAAAFTPTETAEGVYTLTDASGNYLALIDGAVVMSSTEATEWQLTELADYYDIGTPKADTYYNVYNCSNNSLYMAEEADGSLVVATSLDCTQRIFWEYVPATTERCYYIRNATTGNYIASNAGYTMSAASTMSTTDEPVEYYVGLDVSTNSTNGYYYLTSTDNSNYSTQSSFVRGLNKDGGSTNVIVWNNNSGSTNSYWQFAETEYLYDLVPFSPSDTLGSYDYAYTIDTQSSGALTTGAEGTLSLATKDNSDAQGFYFVGTSNLTEGFLIASTASPAQTLNLSGETLTMGESNEPTRWKVFELLSGTVVYYYFRPYDQADEEGTALVVDGDSLFLFRTIRSAYARSAQIYTAPCATLGDMYISSATITGEVQKPMTYPLQEESNSSIVAADSEPDDGYTLYTSDKAIVMRERTFTLDLTLSGTPADDDELFIYFDWDANAMFDASYTIDLTATDLSLKVTVPADAALGKTRMRIRLTDNGLSDAEDEVVGQMLDCIVIVDEASDLFIVTAKPNDTLRGTATLSQDASEGVAAGTSLTATATPRGTSEFVCWTEGRNVVSLDKEYTFNVSGRAVLVANFSSQTDYEITGISDATAGLTAQSAPVTIQNAGGTILVSSTSEIKCVRLYTADGCLVLTTTATSIPTGNLPLGTYIVKAYTADSNAAANVLIK